LTENKGRKGHWGTFLVIEMPRGGHFVRYILVGEKKRWEWEILEHCPHRVEEEREKKGSRVSRVITT